MIIRMYPTDGLKGQQALSPGHRPGYSRQATFALQGQKRYIRVSPKVMAYEGDAHLYRLLPFQGGACRTHFPRAMPWAKFSSPLRGAIGYMRIIIKMCIK